MAIISIDELQKKSSPNIISIDELEKISLGERKGLLNTEAYREQVAPSFVEPFNTALGNVPKSLITRFNPQLAEDIFPEQQTAFGKFQRFSNEVPANMIGAPARLAGKVFLKAEPLAQRFGNLGKIAQGAATGATFGAATAQPTEEEYIKNVGINTAFGGAVPLAGQFGKGLGKGISETGKFISKNFGGVTDATRKVIEKLGADRVFEPIKAQADYIGKVVVPKAVNKIRGDIQNFSQNIQKIAREDFKVPEQAIKDIQGYGVNDLEKTASQYGGSTDEIFQNIQNGFIQKENIANQAYRKALNNVPEGKTIDVKPAIEEAGRRLRSIGLINKNGNLTELGQSEIARDSVYGKLLDFYKSADALSGVKRIKDKGAISTFKNVFGEKSEYFKGNITVDQGKKMAAARFETKINKEQYTFLRDKLNSLWKGKPSDVDIGKVVNQFYQAGENSGMKGLQQAREMTRKVFEMQEKFMTTQGELKPLAGEKSLDRFYKLSSEQVRKLEELESFTGVKALEDVRKVTAWRYLKDIESKLSDPLELESRISSLGDPKRSILRKQYQELIGDDLFDDVQAHFANRDFNLVTDVPGTGGGIYPSRAGLLRTGVAGATKKYYKDIKPSFQRFGEFVSPVRQSIKEFYGQPLTTPEFNQRISSKGGFINFSKPDVSKVKGIVEKAGGRFVGVQKNPNGDDLILFDTPSGSTKGLPKSKISIANVEDSINEFESARVQYKYPKAEADYQKALKGGKMISQSLGKFGKGMFSGVAASSLLKPNPTAKGLIAKAENYGNTEGDYAQLEDIVIKDLQQIKKLDKDITLEKVKADPKLYDHVVALYWDRLGKMGIPEKDRALWWLMPGRYKAAEGNINNLKNPKFRNIMRNRIKNMTGE